MGRSFFAAMTPLPTLTALSLALLLGIAPISAVGKDFCISLAELPTLAQTDGTGPMVELVKLFRRHYPEGKIELLISPFARSLAYVERGRCDLHLPFIANPDVPMKLPGLTLTQMPFGDVPFVLYYKRGRPVPNLNQADQLQIETDQAHVGMFPFPTRPSSCMPCSVRKVAAGRVDGLVFAAKEINSLVIKEKLDVAQVFYRRFLAHGVVQQSQRGMEADAIFSRLLAETQASGEFQQVMAGFLSYDWKLPPP
ncbi:hypothetical protein [Chitinimonas naiadis]